MKLNIAALIFLFAVSSTQVFAQSLEMMMEQNRQQQMMLDAQMRAHMNQQQQNLDASLKEYIEKDYDKLEAERQQFVEQTGQEISIEQYARDKVFQEAARRNAAMQPKSNSMFEQQKQMFEAGQRAHFQRQQTFDNNLNNWNAGQQQIENNNNSWRDQQRQIDGSNQRFIQQGIQGNQYYRNTETGEVTELPFAGPTGVYQNNEGGTWTSDKMGEYKQVDPQYGGQEMEAYEPGYGDE